MSTEKVRVSISCGFLEYGESPCKSILLPDGFVVIDRSGLATYRSFAEGHAKELGHEVTFMVIDASGKGEVTVFDGTTPVNSGTDAPPRITGKRRLECLERELTGVLARWDRTTNPVLHLAAGQLRQAMHQAQSIAYEPRLEWEEARHAERSDL